MGKMPAPELDVLRCAACGADVSLDQADDGRCVHCGQAVRIPESHRELRSLQREDQSARHRAQALLSTLDSPPWLLTRVLAAVFDQPALAFWFYFGVPVGLVSIAAGLAVDAQLHPSPAATVGVIFVVLFAFAFLPRSLGIYANRRAGARRVLLAGLAAQPPRSPGGPARCRSCGAPLEIPAGAVLARCLHCGVESAVRIRTPFLARVRRATRAAVRTLDEAAAIDRRERAAMRRELVRELRRYGLATSTFGGLFAVWAWDYQRVSDRDDGSAPALGILALVIGAFLLIAMLFRSSRTDPHEVQEARDRRGDSDLPPWVRVLGPIGFWVVLWGIRLLVWR